MKHASERSVGANPVISVIIPVHNAVPFVEEAVHSVLAQDYSSFELLLLDDESSDGSREIIERYRSDPRVRIFWQKNQGVAATRNRLIELARGRFIASLDHDDIMLPGRLRKHADYLLAHPETDVVYGDAVFLDEGGVTVGSPRMFIYRTSSKALDRMNAFRLFPNGATTFKKEAFCRTTGYQQRCVPCEDVDLWMRMEEAGATFHYLRGVGYVYRLHLGSQTYDFRSSKKIQDILAGILSEASERRAGGLLRTLVIPFRQRDVSVRTNDTHIAAILKEHHRPAAPSPTGSGPPVTRATVYAVEHIAGLFHLVPFSEVRESISHVVSDDGDTLYWRSLEHSIIGRARRATDEILVFVDRHSKLTGYPLADHLLFPGIRFLFLARGIHFLHASAVERAGRALMLLGPSRAGKTTLTAGLVKQGFRLLGDEWNPLAFDERGILRIFGGPRHFHIQPRMLSRLALSVDRRERILPGSGEKVVVPPLLLFSERQEQRSAVPSVLVFPRFVSGTIQARCQSLDPGRVRKFLHQSTYAAFGKNPEDMLSSLSVLHHLMETTSAYVCEYGDGEDGLESALIELERCFVRAAVKSAVDVHG